MTPSRTTAGSDFAVLARRISGEGLMQRRPAYYVARLSVVTLMFLGGWTAFFLIGSSWWQLVTAVFLAVTFTQVALVAHDLAHRQVFRTKRPGEFAGRIAGNLAVGMSYGWWMDKHTRHHNNPNHDDLDPDVAPEVLIWATNSALGRRGLKGFITRHQAALFFPLLTLLAADLKVSSIKVLRNGTVKRRGLERVVVGVRPEDLILGEGRQIRATVSVIESLGHERHVICRLEGGQLIIVRQAANVSPPAEASEVGLAADAARLHVFDAESEERVDA